MVKKTQLKAWVAISTSSGLLSFVIRLWVAGGFEFSIVPSSIGTAMTTALVLQFIYRKFLWKYDPFLKVPNLSGKREVVLEFRHAISPNTDRNIPAEEIRLYRKKAQVEIKQEVCDIVLMLLNTEQINSKVQVGRLVRENDSSPYTLYYIYRTNSHSGYRVDNPDQYGACHACFDITRGYWIGDYWTDQLTRGTIHFADMDTVKANTPEQEARQVEYLL